MNPRHDLAELRAQLIEMADAVAPYSDPPAPDRMLPSTKTSAGGPLWAVPQYPKGDRLFCALTVRCVDGEPGVYVEGANFSWQGDWHSLSSTEARSFALALLAAAAWSDGGDVLAQRRARKAGEAS